MHFQKLFFKKSGEKWEEVAEFTNFESEIETTYIFQVKTYIKRDASTNWRI